VYTYLVTLADRNDADALQRILVDAKTPDRMQEFVDTLTDLQIANPTVISVRKLAIKRRLPRTTLQSAVKTAV
jgi:hypothetical protein